MSTLMERDMRSDKDEIARLNTDIAKLEADLRREKFRRAEAELEARILRDQRNQGMMVPIGDATYGYECSGTHCSWPVDTDMNFCPGCGREIDWGHWRDTTEPDIDQWRDR